MNEEAPSPSPAAKDLHPRNRHRFGYDFPALIASSPELANFIVPNPAGNDTVDFADPAAVKALNRALLIHHYGITHWDIPAGYLCPPIPGRADYLHRVADLLAEDNESEVPRGKTVKVLDIGVGANCVYPIIGAAEFGWKFVGSDIDPIAVRWAQELATANRCLKKNVECRWQPKPEDIFPGILKPGDQFALSICNPPFHDSPASADASARRKVQNLGAEASPEPVLNFGGSSSELWCKGGESAFIRRMIRQSATLPDTCRWFTTLVSKAESLPGIGKALKAAKVREQRTIALNHGQKVSRIVAWTFW